MYFALSTGSSSRAIYTAIKFDTGATSSTTYSVVDVGFEDYEILSASPGEPNVLYSGGDCGGIFGNEKM